MTVKLLRRTPQTDEPAPAPAEQADPRHTPGKGRPTPKRRDAQGRRPGPVPPPPRTRREAYRRLRDKNAGRRVEVREAMKSGDDRYLPPRDKGPVKALVRDIVDSRRNIGSSFILVAVIVLATYAIPDTVIRTWAMSLWLVAFLFIIVDSFVLSARIRRLVRERFPDDKTRGLVWYGVQRSTMIRRWRMPAARLRPGDKL